MTRAHTPGTAFVLTHESDPHRTARSLNIIALSITRSLGRHGVRVIRVHPNELECGLTSRYCHGVEISPDLYESEEALLEFLLALERVPGPRVLFPASDDCAAFVAHHRDALARVFALPVADRAVMESILDKRRQYGLAERLGLPIPETHFPTDAAEARTIASRARSFPYVIKPLVSHRWRLKRMAAVSGGRKAIVVHGPAELVTEYERIRALDPEVMVQEIVPGEDERLVTFLSYLDAGSRPLGHCIRKKIRQHPIDFGHCMVTVSCADDAVKDQSLRFLRGIGYRGLSGIEWKRDPRDGALRLIELNARAVQTIGIAAACGVDLPWIAYQDQIGRPPAPLDGFEPGVKWAWITGDLRNLRHVGTSPVALAAWVRSIAGARTHAVFAADDLKPIRTVLGKSLRGAMRRVFAPLRALPSVARRTAS
ncbi:MAG: hypothetical protein ACREQJ_03780 [Candidatus Binatia bacterium]